MNMEGFCRPVGRKGPAWVQHVVDEYDLAQAEELEGARQFVREIWHNGSVKTDASNVVSG